MSGGVDFATSSFFMEKAEKAEVEVMARQIGKSNNRRQPTVGLYIENIQHPQENNEELFAQLEATEDEYKKAEIRELIILNNLKTIHSVIYRRYGSRLQLILQKNRMTYGDLYSIGYELLIRAVDKFDISLGYKFTTLSYTMLHNGFSKYFYRLKTPDSNLSIEAPQYTNEDGSEVTIADTLDASDTGENVEEEVTNTVFLIQLLDELEKIHKPRDMAIIRAHMSGQYKRQADLGAEFGISQVQVSRIIKTIQKTAREIRDRLMNEVV